MQLSGRAQAKTQTRKALASVPITGNDDEQSETDCTVTKYLGSN